MNVDGLQWSNAPLAPVAAAIAASSAGFWQEAIDLWRDRLRSEAFGRIAATCAAEAALRSGRFGLADHMLVQLGEAPAHLAALAGEAEEVRARRAAWFASGQRPGAAEELLALALYREAIGAASQAELPRQRALGLAIRALSGLGEHRRVLGLEAEADDADPDVARALAAARTACAAREVVPAAAVEGFRAGHPAGPELDRALAALAPA